MKREAAWAYLFIAPQMVGLLAFALALNRKIAFRSWYRAAPS